MLQPLKTAHQKFFLIFSECRKINSKIFGILTFALRNFEFKIWQLWWELAIDACT
jgi:hypothetical protein